ncbi:MAG: glycoside-pentoside-hexuronide (GPH):cation symporter [Pseudomonadota bacterium]
MTGSRDVSSSMTFGAKAGYGVGMSGLWLTHMTVAVYLFYYYTDVFGISPAQAGTIFFAATMWDAVTDPLMGWMASRTRAKLGRYRPYILFGGAPLAVCFLLMFIRPDLAGVGLFAYALGAHLLFKTAFTVVYIPYTAMIAQLSFDADERASIAGVKTVFIALGSLVVAFFGLPLIDAFGGGDDRKGFFLVAALFAVGAASALTLCGAITRERAADASSASESRDTETSSPFEALSLLVRNGAFVKVFLGVIVFTGCYTILNKLTVYHFQYNLNARADARWALSAISLAGVIAPMIWAAITARTGKRFVWIAGAMIAAASLVSFYILNPKSVAVISGFYFVAGIGIMGVLMTFYAMAADTIDYGEWKDGRRAEAIGFGVLSFANKTSLAIGGGLLGVLLSAIGYVSGETQTEETLEGIRLSLAVLPAVGFLLSAIVISFFKLSAARHRKIIADISARRRDAAT